mmetsp:Transcript_60884/g.199358  ORF Transcript_60884/g.199358 Transcript_60884/m.199358 type:complete len:275 (+) Transcript_60884:46-870(+)
MATACDGRDGVASPRGHVVQRVVVVEQKVSEEVALGEQKPLETAQPAMRLKGTEATGDGHKAEAGAAHAAAEEEPIIPDGDDVDGGAVDEKPITPEETDEQKCAPSRYGTSWRLQATGGRTANIPRPGAVRTTRNASASRKASPQHNYMPNRRRTPLPCRGTGVRPTAETELARARQQTNRSRRRGTGGYPFGPLAEQGRFQSSGRANRRHRQRHTWQDEEAKETAGVEYAEGLQQQLLMETSVSLCVSVASARARRAAVPTGCCSCITCRCYP